MLRDDFPQPGETEFHCPVQGPAAPSAALPQLTGDRRRGHVALTVFYNGACLICRARVARYQAVAATSPALIAWCDVSEAPWALARWQVGAEAALTTVHLLDRHGVLRSGAAAFARLWRELPGYRWLGWLASLPGAGLIGEPIYRRASALVHGAAARGRTMHHA
jgi:predicted DCC family thiol-disulfide oxidoreductase YuxK